MGSVNLAKITIDIIIFGYVAINNVIINTVNLENSIIFIIITVTVKIIDIIIDTANLEIMSVRKGTFQAFIYLWFLASFLFIVLASYESTNRAS